MEFIFEFLLDLILEGSIEISTNKKISKFIRYPLICLIALFFIAVILLILFVGLALLNENVLAALLTLLIAIILLVFGILKFKNMYIERKDKYNV